MAREDIHRPSITDPAEYVLIGEGDRGSQEDPGFFFLDRELYAQETARRESPGAARLLDQLDRISAEQKRTNPQSLSYSALSVDATRTKQELAQYLTDDDPMGRQIDGNFERRGRCDHCGAGPLRFFTVVLHRPTGDVITVGDKCGSDLGLDSRSDRAKKQARERHRIQALKDAAIEANPQIPEAVEFLEQRVTEGDYGYEGMFHSILHKWNRYGNMSEKQVAVALRAKERQAERDAKRRAEAELDRPVVEGRIVIEGEVLSTKWQDNDFGGSLKMLVRDDRGFKVWGTVPSSLELMNGPTNDAGIPNWQRSVDRGDRVRFTATVEASKDDPCFGFYKRPSKAKALELVPPAPKAEAFLGVGTG